MSDKNDANNIRSDTRIASLLANLSGILAEHSRKTERICKAVAEKFFPNRIFFFTTLGALHDIGDLVLSQRVIYQEHSGERRRSEEEHITSVRAGFLFLRSIHADLADLILHHHELLKYATGEIEFADPSDFPAKMRATDLVGQKFSSTSIVCYLDPDEKKKLGLAMAVIEAHLERRRIDNNVWLGLSMHFPQLKELEEFISQLLISTPS